MSEVQSYVRSLQRSQESLTRADRPSVFTMRGRDWDLLDEVFAPIYSPSTGIALDFLGLGPGPGPEPGLGSGLGSGLTDGAAEAEQAPLKGSLLEIGCGTGIIAVTAALAGCGPVVAADISERAVENAARNAARHGVSDRVRAVHGDLFSGLGPGERFDTIFWSSNYVRAPEDYEYRSVHERAYVDAGYAVHRRYLAEAPQWLTAGGSVLLHFSNRGDVEGLNAIAAETGRELRVLATRSVPEGGDMVEHMLLEAVSARTAAAN
ncbi:methyltransferase domain-containing protein [Streptomyces sp. 8N616]|uniref:methyltransferase domain-containing protein n=1 Tax=Streptomyces sp. 8N616 TaxID=3457414 RepID=UPI003FD1C09B